MVLLPTYSDRVFPPQKEKYGVRRCLYFSTVMMVTTVRTSSAQTMYLRVVFSSKPAGVLSGQECVCMYVSHGRSARSPILSDCSVCQYYSPTLDWGARTISWKHTKGVRGALSHILISNVRVLLLALPSRSFRHIPSLTPNRWRLTYGAVDPITLVRTFSQLH